MSNPTLVTTDTTWAGWTVDQIVDEVLRPFGLTNDTTDSRDRVLANTDELTLAKDGLRLAFTYLHSKYQNVWSRRIFTGTWVADDHSLMLPANVKYLDRVFIGGVPLTSITQEDRTRYMNADVNGGDWKTESTQGVYYWISGVADADLVVNGGAGTGTQDWRLVLRIAPAPGSADSIELWYTARSPLLGTGADVLGTDTLYQDWLACRATEILASKLGGAVGVKDSAREQRLMVEDDIFNHLEGTAEFPDRVRTAYPPLADTPRGTN